MAGLRRWAVRISKGTEDPLAFNGFFMFPGARGTSKENRRYSQRLSHAGPMLPLSLASVQVSCFAGVPVGAYSRRRCSVKTIPSHTTYVCFHFRPLLSRLPREPEQRTRTTRYLRLLVRVAQVRPIPFQVQPGSLFPTPISQPALRMLACC